MLPQIASIAIIGTAVWMFTADPLHKLHHAPAPKPVHHAQFAKLPVKSGTTSAEQWRKALNEAAVLIGERS